MTTWDCDCVGCPQGCVLCGRQHWYLRVTCDICGDTIVEGGDRIDGKDICDNCLDDMDNEENDEDE